MAASRSLYTHVMRTPLAAIALTILAAGCSTPRFTAEFAAAVRELPPGGRAVVEYRNGKPRRYAASSDPETIPPAARRTAEEFVQPGGTTVSTMREWGASGTGFRFVKKYGEQGLLRSVLVNATGDVLERSHQIPLEAAPGAARASVQSTVDGKIVQVDVIQRKLRSTDHYRFTVWPSDGSHRYVVTTAEGTIVEQGQEASATIFSSR